MITEEKEKIDILLKEYETLRQEILSRTHNRFLMVGIVGAFLAYTLFTNNPILKTYILGIGLRTFVLVSGAIALLVIWLWFGYIVGNLDMRISAIDKRINDLVGEELLEWETRYGWGQWGIFSAASKKKPNKLDRAFLSC